MAKRKSQPRLNLLTETVRRRRRCQKKETSRQLYDGNKLKPKSPATKKKKQQKQDNKNGFENRKLRWRPVQEQLGSGLINVAQFRE